MLSFTLWHCVSVFTKSLHVCNFDPVAHVIYAFEFAFKFWCDKMSLRELAMPSTEDLEMQKSDLMLSTPTMN
jgi:hypothetical protein